MGVTQHFYAIDREHYEIVWSVSVNDEAVDAFEEKLFTTTNEHWKLGIGKSCQFFFEAIRRMENWRNSDHDEQFEYAWDYYQDLQDFFRRAADHKKFMLSDMC